MARQGRPTVEISSRGEERRTLERWARRHSSSQALALRCRIVLGCAEGRTNTEIAAGLGVSQVTVSKWRHRFAVERLDGLVGCSPAGRGPYGSATMLSRRWWWRRSRPRRLMRRTGRRGAWRPSTGSAVRPCPRSGGRSGSSRGRQTASRCRLTRSWWRRSVTWSGLYIEPAGRGGRVRRRRETPDPSARPHRADAADAAHNACSVRRMTTSATAPATSTPP